MRTSIKGRALAIIAGLAFTAGALTILLGPALLTPLEWSSYHVLTIISVFGTTAAGHLLADAGFKHPIAGLGFLVLFLGGTALVVANSVGRQAATFEESTLSAEATNAAIADKSEDLKQARARKVYADAQVQRETSRGGCGRSCKDWKTNASDVAIVIGQLERDIAALGPKKPVNAKAERMAEMAALFGVSKAKAQAMFVLLEPLLNCLFFELGSIVSLGFAFRQGKQKVLIAANDCPSLADNRQTSFPVEFQLPEPPEPPKGKRRKPEIGKGVVDLHEHRVWKAIERNGGSVSSHQELADLLGIDPGPASRLRQEIDDHLKLTKVGKQLRIELKKIA